MFGHGFRRAWYRWIANSNALPTVCVSQPSVTGCRVQFCRLMVITNNTWCHFGARASLALEAWAHWHLSGYMTPLRGFSWCHKPFHGFWA